MSTALDSAAALFPGHPLTFLVPLLSLAGSAFVAWRGRRGEFNRHSYFAAAAFLSVFVALSSSHRMVVAIFRGLAEAGSGGVGSVAAGFFEASVLLMPAGLAAFGIGLIAFVTSKKSPEPSLALDAGAPARVGDGRASGLSWALLVLPAVLAGVLALWYQGYLVWILDVVGGRASLPLPEVSRRVGLHTVVLGILPWIGIVLSLASLVWAAATMRSGNSSTDASYDRAATAAVLVVSLLILVRAASQQSFFYGVALRGSIPVPAGTR